MLSSGRGNIVSLRGGQRRDSLPVYTARLAVLSVIQTLVHESFLYPY
jgi:hypothetical protein